MAPELPPVNAAAKIAVVAANACLRLQTSCKIRYLYRKCFFFLFTLKQNIYLFIYCSCISRNLAATASHTKQADHAWSEMVERLHFIRNFVCTLRQATVRLPFHVSLPYLASATVCLGLLSFPVSMGNEDFPLTLFKAGGGFFFPGLREFWENIRPFVLRLRISFFFLFFFFCFFFFEVEISSRTHSTLCCKDQSAVVRRAEITMAVFPDKLRASWFPGGFPHYASVARKREGRCKLQDCQKVSCGRAQAVT